MWNGCTRRTIICGVLLGGLASLAPPLAGAQSATTRVSVATGGAQGNNFSGRGVVSADGRWVAFVSASSDLVAGDTNAQWDVFLHDRESGATTRVSLGPGGTELSVPSDQPAISADGRIVAFQTGSPLGTTQVFVYDRLSGEVTPISVGPGGTSGNAASAHPAVSADGRWVAFTSRASDLLAGDTNSADDVFLYDRQNGGITRVSVGPDGDQGNSYSSGAVSISADGRWIAFTSSASNLVPFDTNGHEDVFVHDRNTGQTRRVSVGPDASQGNAGSFNPALSADGRWVAFASRATNLVEGDTNGQEDIFVHDSLTGTTSRVSLGPGGVQANANSSGATISPEGRFVAFYSAASNVVPGDTNGRADVFVHDRYTGHTTRVSVGPGGAEGNGGSVGTSISAGGRFAAFESDSSNFVGGDTNNQWDVFVRDRGDAGCTVAVAPPFTGAPAAATAGQVVVVTTASCGWTAESNDPEWLTVTAGSTGTGFGIVEYAVAANTGVYRSGSLSIDGQLFAVEQRDPVTPEPPVELRARAVADRLVTLRWTIPPGGPAPTGFVVEGGLFPTDIQASIPTSSPSPTFTFYAPAGSFYVRVHALNGAVRSAASNEIFLHVDAPVPPSPPAHLLGMVNGSSVALAWTNTYEGGQPTSLWLEVIGSMATMIPLAMTDHVDFGAVPRGTYPVAIRAGNEAGISERSSILMLRVPWPCSGVPATPIRLSATRLGQTVHLDWAPGPLGAAPTEYAVSVTGALNSTFTTSERALSGTVGPGTYNVSVTAINDCGASAATAPVAVVVP
jgi:Tol biopolymer transport system component